MVSVSNSWETCCIWNVVRIEHESWKLGQLVIAQFCEWTVVKTGFKFTCQQHSVFVAGQSAVEVGRWALTWNCLELIPIHWQGARHSRYSYCDTDHWIRMSTHCPSEWSACRVLDNSQLLNVDSDSFSHIVSVEVEGHCLAVDAEVVVFIIVSLHNVAFDWHVRLSWWVEWTFNWVCSVIDEFRNMFMVALQYRQLWIDVLAVCIRQPVVNILSVRSYCFQIAHVFRQRFDFNLNSCSCSFCMLSCICTNQSYYITVVQNLAVSQNVVTLFKLNSSCWECVSHELVCAACCLCILCSDNLINARHLLCFWHINLLDDCVGCNSWLNQSNLQSFCRHVKLDVITVIANTACLRQCVWSFQRLAVEVADVLWPVINEVINSLLASENFCSCHYSVDDVLVACASADISVLLEPVSYIFSSRIWVILQELIWRNDESRNAESALNRTESYPQSLQRMRIVHTSDAFDCGYLWVLFNLWDFAGTWSDYLAVENYWTRTTSAHSAANLCSGQAQTAKHVSKSVFGRITDEHTVSTVNVQSHLL